MAKSDGKVSVWQAGFLASDLSEPHTSSNITGLAVPCSKYVLNFVNSSSLVRNEMR